MTKRVISLLGAELSSALGAGDTCDGQPQTQGYTPGSGLNGTPPLSATNYLTVKTAGAAIPTQQDMLGMSLTISDPLPQFVCSDADGSRSGSVTDAVYLIQGSFAGGPASCADCP